VTPLMWLRDPDNAPLGGFVVRCPLPAQHLWSPGIFSCRLHSLELSPGFYQGPDRQCRLFRRLLKTYLFARY